MTPEVRELRELRILTAELLLEQILPGVALLVPEREPGIFSSLTGRVALDHWRSSEDRSNMKHHGPILRAAELDQEIRELRRTLSDGS